MRNRVVIFIYEVVVLGVLAGLLIAYLDTSFKDFFPDDIQGLPLYAVWFGALGGTVVGITRVLAVNSVWEPEWAIWYYAKPFLSAVLGGVTYVLLLVVGSGEPKTPIVEAAAFIVGIEEKRFFDFLAKIAEVVFAVPAVPVVPEPLTVTGVEPTPAAPGTVLTVSGQSFQPGAIVRLGNFELEGIVVRPDGRSISGTAPAGGVDLVDVQVTNPDGTAYVLRNGFGFG